MLAASDLNPKYLDFWPLVRQAWTEIAGLEPHLVLVADEAEAPAALRDDPSVHLFPPLQGVHTAFQAQCLRLLYPAILDAPGAVITSDADMVPLSRTYFHRPVAHIDESHFVAYRDVLLAAGEIPICYNAALPRTWGSIFDIESLDDVRTRLGEWAAVTEYSGEHGGIGWATDQRLLYRTLVERARRTRTVWILDDHYTRFHRLERAALRKTGSLDARDRALIARGTYSDFHCVHPFEQFEEVNRAAVELAIGARRKAS